MENLIASCASAIAAIATAIIAVIFGSSQKKQEKNAQKIALFDKRYEIYKTMIDLYGIMKFATLKVDSINEPDHLIIADMMLQRYGLMKDETFLGERRRLRRLVETAQKEERDKADRDWFYLDWHANNQLLQLRDKILSDIEPSKFCFEKEIYFTFIRAFNELFDYIIIFKPNCAVEEVRDKGLLVKYINEIEQLGIFEKIEGVLAIDEDIK